MPPFESFNRETNTMTLSPGDVRAMSDIAWNESMKIAQYNPDEAARAYAMVFDAIMNRAAAPAYSVYGTQPSQLAKSVSPTTIQAVIDAPSQFSPVSLQSTNRSWTGLTSKAPDALQDFGAAYTAMQARGMPQFGFSQLDAPVAPDVQGPPMPSVMGTHYSNPPFSTDQSWQNRIEPFAAGVGRYGGAYHQGGTLKGEPRPAGPYNVEGGDESAIGRADLTGRYSPFAFATPDLFGAYPEFTPLDQPAPAFAPSPPDQTSPAWGLPEDPQFTEQYQDIAKNAPSFLGGIGALPGEAIDAIKAPVEGLGLFDMFSAPAPPAPPAAAPTSQQAPAAPSNLYGMFSPPAPPAAVPPGVNVELVDTIPTPEMAPPSPPAGYSPTRMAQAVSMLPDNYVQQEARYPTQPVEEADLTPIPAAPIESIIGSVQQSLDNPTLPASLSEAAIMARSPTFDYDDFAQAPSDLAPRAPSINTTMPEVMTRAPDYGAPPSPPGNPEDTFGLATALNVAPEDYAIARQVPGIGLTGTPQMGFPSFAPPDQFAYDTPAMPPGMTMPAAPPDISFATPPTPFSPSAKLDSVATAPMGDMTPSAGAISTTGGPRIDMAAGMDLAKRDLANELFNSEPVAASPYGAVGHFPTEAITRRNEMAPPSLAPMSMAPGQNFQMAAPVQSVFGVTPQNGVQQSFSIPTPPTDLANVIGMGQTAGLSAIGMPAPPQSLRDIAPPTISPTVDQFAYNTPAAPPGMTLPAAPAVPVAPAPAVSPVDAAFQAAPQPALSAPVTGAADQLNNGPPTAAQLADAKATIAAAAVPAAPAPAQTAPLDTSVAAPGPSPIAGIGRAIAAPAPASPPTAAPAANAIAAAATTTPTSPIGPIGGGWSVSPIAQAGPAPSPEQVATQMQGIAAAAALAAPQVAAPAPDIGQPSITAAPQAPAAPAPPAPPAAPAPPAPELDRPVGPLPGGHPTPQEAPGLSVENPEVQSPSPFSGGFTPGQPTFGGGPIATNMAGDYDMKSMGPDYSGPGGINTNVYSGVADLSALGQLGSVFGGPPSPPGDLSSLGMDTLVGGAATDTMGGGGGFFGGFAGFDGGGYTEGGGSPDAGGGGYADGGGTTDDGSSSDGDSYADGSDFDAGFADDDDDFGW